jgi:hypothetical protein
MVKSLNGVHEYESSQLIQRCQFVLVTDRMGEHGSVVVKALCYKPEGRVFDIRLGDLLYHLTAWSVVSCHAVYSSVSLVR